MDEEELEELISILDEDREVIIYNLKFGIYDELIDEIRENKRDEYSQETLRDFSDYVKKIQRERGKDGK